jgi:hypothetical protein
MSTDSNSRDVSSSCEVTAHPQETTAGGIVLIVARPENGTYRVRWRVIGPVRLSAQDTRIALLGATTVTGRDPVVIDERNPEIRATLDTTPLAVGSWQVRLTLIPVGDKSDGGSARGNGKVQRIEGSTDLITVSAKPLGAGDDLSVTMKPAAVPPTEDQALWVAIRNGTNAIGFENFQEFMDRVMCDAGYPLRDGRVRQTARRVARRTALPFPHVDQYRLLKAAAEVFLMLYSGVNIGDFRNFDVQEESVRLNRTVTQTELEQEFRDYLVEVPTGDGRFLDVLPYLELIRLKLRDVPIVGSPKDEAAARVCYGILADKLANPSFIELLWSYWIEKGGLPRTVGAINWRFQNRTVRGRDPLIGLDIDPLRGLNNLLWGYGRDAQHRLTAAQRRDEYQHLYGLGDGQRPGSGVRNADVRSRFVQAFHDLLTLASEFYRNDDVLTVKADAFGLLNALRDVHLLLSEGAHNQYGDLPWTARQEMLMEQFIVAMPQVREFLPIRTMVPDREEWIGAVDSMNRLQGWSSDISALHYRDLAVFGEQLLLSIRFGDWVRVNASEQAANFARYWRREVRGYIHAYRAVSGIDLGQPVTRTAITRPAQRQFGAFQSN